MAQAPYARNVFLNCPFDEEYSDLLKAIVFAIMDCGLLPRCALEFDDASETRIDKLFRLVRDSRFGIHDISRTELDHHNMLPRFNMPLELGMFLAAKRFGDRHQRAKSCLVLDRERYRYREFISDISGQDIESHDGDPQRAVVIVRNWLQSASGRSTIPSGELIWQRYVEFCANLPNVCAILRLTPGELTYLDNLNVLEVWLKQVGSI